MDRYLAHLRIVENEVEPHAFDTLFIELGKSQIEFDHRLSAAELELADELFGIRPMADIEAREDLERPFTFDPRVDTKKVLPVKPLRARVWKLDCQ